MSLEEMEFMGGEQLTWGHLLVKASPTKDEKGNDRNGLHFRGLHSRIKSLLTVNWVCDVLDEAWSARAGRGLISMSRLNWYQSLSKYAKMPGVLGGPNILDSWCPPLLVTWHGVPGALVS